MSDIAQALREEVLAAVSHRSALRIRGGDSKGFYGNRVAAPTLELGGHHGIVSHEPTELVLSARAGTPLVDIESSLAKHGQMLSFEPPHFAGGATIGGAVASGLAGPRRPWGGAPRDHVLGVKLLDGQGQILSFGGQVMKNVAGYDISRLMAGSLGTLGVLLEVSLKVLPAPAKTRTLVIESDRDKAVRRMRELSRQPVPLSGACHLQGKLYLRLSGSHASVNAWKKRIGGDELAERTTFWQRLRDHQLDFFKREQPLWRISLPGNTPRLDCEQETLTDWAGAQRWVYTSEAPDKLRSEIAALGGHAEAFCRHANIDAFQTPPPLMLELHQRLRQRFDPHGIFNPGRIFRV